MAFYRGPGGYTSNAEVVTDPVGVGQGGTGATTAAEARQKLGLGTMATQNATNVQILGGTISDNVTYEVSNLKSIPIIFNGSPQEDDVLMFSANSWTNKPHTYIADGGNF